MAATAKGSDRNPSTNRPVDCLLCTSSDGPQWQWTYNLAAHIDSKHSDVDEDNEVKKQMRQLADVSEERGKVIREFGWDRFDELATEEHLDAISVAVAEIAADMNSSIAINESIEVSGQTSWKTGSNSNLLYLRYGELSDI